MVDQILVIVGITFLVMISPGPDMVLVLRNTLLGGQFGGLLTSLGVLTGNLVHITYCVVGIGWIISQSILAFTALKYAAAGYLITRKVEGEFVWHDHSDEDEMFWVIKGEMDLRFRDKTVHLGEGDFYVISKGVEHNPKAEEECCIVLLEPKSTKHTGDVIIDATKSIDEQLKG